MRSRFVRIITIFVTAVGGLAVAGATSSSAAPAPNAYTEYAVGINGGEPSIGFDPVRNAALYGAGTDTRRLTWDANGKMTSTDVKAPTARATLDAITIVDQRTGRTFNSQLAGLCSLTSFSNDAGASWTPSQGCGVPTFLDHESLGAGPFHAPVPANPVYPDAVYYCAQNGFNASCATSFDGGLAFGPGSYVQNTPANDPNDPNPQFAAEGGACVGLHGHVKVGPDGTAYLPLAGCGGQPTLNDGTNYEYWGGRPSLSISDDNGATWLIHMIPAGRVPNGRGSFNRVSAMDEGDPSVSISRPTKAAPSGNVYFAWQNGTDKSDVKGGTTSQAMVAVSHDDGAKWSKPVDVSSPLGLNNVMFTEIVAGNAHSAAVAFLGTAARGDTQTNAFPTNRPWRLYVATTYDGGRTWHTVDATPTDPVQRGCIDMQGTTIPPSPRADICSQRNLLDFNDITVDRDGRVLAAYSDGCDATCGSDPQSHSTGAVDMVVRQTGGMGLYGKPVHR